MEQLAILKNWERAKLAIRECKDIDEAKDIRDKAQALKVYAQQARESLEVQNNIAEIKIRAERRIGEFSRELETQQGGETRFGTHHYGENQTKTQALKDVGKVCLATSSGSISVDCGSARSVLPLPHFHRTMLWQLCTIHSRLSNTRP